MGQLVRDYQWSASKLGETETWPQSLQSAVSICLNSNFPIAIYWGEDLVLIYNDAWSAIPGNKHPWALGKPAIEVWPEIWNDIEPQFQKAFNGIPGGSKDALLPMQRHGYTEECYFDFTFTPIYGASGKVEGIFNAVIETTYRVINERRARFLQRLSDAINAVSSPDEVFLKAAQVLNEAEEDISFYCIVELEQGHAPIVKACTHGFGKPELWPIEDALNGVFKYLDNIHEAGLHVSSNFWPEAPTEAVVVPLKANDGAVFGSIIAGLSARRKYDKDYKTFFESVATIIAGELNTIKSLAEERKRAEALAQIDKAKTAFFSNISHEFRTPLTLMIGPLQTLLGRDNGLSQEDRDNLSTAYRNTLRLQKLVNTLLDFSRIEAGKMEAKFQEVNISEYTRDLTSSFRSAIESADIKYEVSIEEMVAVVDVDMWEKIVLNLISNAFKYTKKGTIAVRMVQDNDHLVLKVSDTGIGIKQEDQDKIFERFYRVNSSDSRSQEGTGIGLSMVKELVHLHKGEITVESEPGKGSTFIVSIPAVIHTSNELSENNRPISSSTKYHFIEEVLHWNDYHDHQIDLTAVMKHSDALKAKVLLADDNSDMRAYVHRLLQDEFDVRTVMNGEDAFSMAVEWMPDLILSDIMMPKLDGFGLLQKLKGSLVTRNIPLIFLSARAGEEAKVEGIKAGADDYLVKPFSAKELLARVNNKILTNKTRRQTENEFYNLFLQAPAHIHVMKGPDHVMEFFHPLGRKFLGGRDITGMKIREALPEMAGQGYFEMLDQVYNDGKSFYISESKATFPGDDGKPEDYYFNITYLPLRDVNGNIEGVLQFTIDVTQQSKTNQQIKESEERFRLLVTSVPQIIWIADSESNIEFLSDQWERYTGVSVGEGIKHFASYIHPDDVGAVREKWYESIQLKKPWKSEFRLKDVRTGQYRWFFGHTLPLLSEKGDIIKWIGSASDIHIQKTANEQLEGVVAERTTELVDLNKILKRKNEELSRAQTFLRTVLDASVELVTAFDKDLNITFVNNRLKTFSGRAPEDLMGKHLLEVHPEVEKTEGYEHLKRALNGETIHVEARRPNDDDSLIFENIYFTAKTPR